MLLQARRRLVGPLAVALAIVIISLVVPTAVQPVSAQTIVATVSVGTNPRGVAVNPSTNRIYVTNWGSNNTSVINGATNTVVDTLGGGTQPSGVAVNPTTNHIYIASTWGSDSKVAVFDGATNTLLGTARVGTGPWHIAVNPATNRIYVSNWGSNNVWVFYDDGFTLTFVTIVNVGTGPSGVAVNPATNRIYVANWGSSNVSVIDGNTNTVVYILGMVNQPWGIAVNPATNRIYVTNQGSDNVSVIDDDGVTLTIVATVAVGDWPRGVAVNPSTNRIYVANYDGDTVSVIDGNTNTVVATVAVGDWPDAVAVNPSTNHIYVANWGSNNVSVIFNPDITPPAAVTDLTVTHNSVTLSWTAPGDDGNVGTASQYDIRYSRRPITEANWASATQCAGEPAPQPPGTTQTFTVTNLLPGAYYFALKTADEVPNWSGLSNVVTATIFTSQAGRRASSTPPKHLSPANLGTFGLNIGPQAAAPNQPVTIATNVVNTGDEGGNYTVALKVNGQVEETRVVGVGPQGTQPVKFTVTRSQPGTYAVDVGGQKGSFTVLGGGGTAGRPTNGGLIAILIVGVLVLATIAALAATRRRAA